MNPRKNERNQAIYEARQNGMTFTEIGRKFNLSQGRTVKIYHNQVRWNAERAEK